jgi:glyoxylate carboligase
MKVSDLVVKCLEAEGVRYVFGLPGEETEDLLSSFEDSSIKFVPCRHEQGAAFIVDVWGRFTAQGGLDRLGHESHQRLDIVQIAVPALDAVQRSPG